MGPQCWQTSWTVVPSSVVTMLFNTATRVGTVLLYHHAFTNHMLKPNEHIYICMYVFLSCKACIGAGSSTAQLCPWLVWFTHLRLDMLDEKLYTSWTPALKCWAAGSVIWYLHRILQFMPMLHWFGAYLSFIPLIVSSDHVERPHKVSQWKIDTLIAVSWEVLQPLEYVAMVVLSSLIVNFTWCPDAPIDIRRRHGWEPSPQHGGPVGLCLVPLPWARLRATFTPCTLANKILAAKTCFILLLLCWGFC